MKDLLIIVLCIALGFMIYDKTHNKKPQTKPTTGITQPQINSDMDAVYLKNGTVVQGRISQKNGHVGIVLEPSTIERIVVVNPSPTPTPKPVKASPPSPVIDNTICKNCKGQGYTEVTCPSCNGNGKRKCPRCRGEGFDFKNCRICGGQGVVYRKDTYGNTITIECECRKGDPRQNTLTRCPDCHGIGTLPCRTCNGAGSVKNDCPYCVGGKKR